MYSYYKNTLKAVLMITILITTLVYRRQSSTIEIWTSMNTSWAFLVAMAILKLRKSFSINTRSVTHWDVMLAIYINFKTGNDNLAETFYIIEVPCCSILSCWGICIDICFSFVVYYNALFILGDLCCCRLQHWKLNQSDMSFNIENCHHDISIFGEMIHSFQYWDIRHRWPYGGVRPKGHSDTWYGDLLGPVGPNE